MEMQAHINVDMVSVKDYIEDMVTFTVLARIYSNEYFSFKILVVNPQCIHAHVLCKDRSLPWHHVQSSNFMGSGFLIIETLTLDHLTMPKSCPTLY